MAKDPFQYIFRFCCDPGFNDKEEIDALMRYVDEADVDDVAVFCNVEEINTGHMSFSEQDVFLNMMKSIQPLLAQKGITMSVNHWHSVMHADLGKHFAENQHFRPMVDIKGNTAALCVCPLCTGWQDYIGKIYARYAELDPSILWVEDDFRLHNHDPLVWGGCFCDEHMKLYSQLAGKELTREEFLAGVLQPGEVHPYRKIWLDVAKETMLSAARAISKAVREVSKQSKVGLMSSVPYVHAAEGRDWHAILNTLAGGAAPVNRIHLPGYQESVPSTYLRNFNMVSMMNRAMIPAETEVYPELENFPFSLFSKSRAFTRFQLLSGLPLNLAGITIDLYDLNGNGIVWEDGYQDMLREVKPYLNTLTELGVFKGERRGVKILYNPRSSYTIHTTAGKSMEELYPQECFWAGLLPGMGIPYAYSDDITMEGEIVAVSGQVLRNYTEAELKALFDKNFVILTGDAAWTLYEMGLGHLAGIESAKWVKQDNGTFAYEQVTNGKTYRGRKNARASAIVVCSDVLDVQYRDDVKVNEYSAMYDSFRRRTLPCQSVVNGKVLVYPYGHFEAPGYIPVMLLNALRQEILQDVLRAAGANFPMVVGSPYLEPHYIVRDGEEYLYLINGNSDTVCSVRLTVLGLPETVSCRHCICNGDETTLQCDPVEGGSELHVAIRAMETVLVKLR